MQERLDQGVWDFMDVPGNEFFSFLMSNMKIKIDPNHPYKTAWTNGTTIGFHPEFTLKCSRKELIGVFYHELQHVIYEHVNICLEMGLDHELHNIACDHYNNLEAQAQGWELPHFITPYRDKKFKGWSSMEIYDYLVNNEEEAEEQKAQMGDGLGADIELELDEGMTPEQAKEAVQDAIIQAVIQCDMAGNPGSVPSEVRRMYDEVTAPVVDWWKILVRKMTKYCKDDWSMQRPNRRHQHRGMYLPTLHSPAFGSIAFGFDVSGSMDNEALGLCVSVAKQIRTMVKPETVHIMCFDTEVHECGSISKYEPFTNVELVGGGGTDVNPFLELCREVKPDIMICFTDGGFYAPPAQYEIAHEDLYWVLTESPYCKDLKGTQIRMDQIKRRD